MPLLYKGVAPGTHNAGDAVEGLPFSSSTVDPRRAGFHGDPNMPYNHNAVMRHIVHYSWPSPYVSASYSFAVAADYAGQGGWVFEIDPDLDPSIQLVSPVQALATNFPHIHEHDGHQRLVHGIVAPDLYGTELLTPALGPGRNGAAAQRASAPRVSDPLTALLFAVRDSEVLLRSVPARMVSAHVQLVP